MNDFLKKEDILKSLNEQKEARLQHIRTRVNESYLELKLHDGKEDKEFKELLDTYDYFMDHLRNTNNINFDDRMKAVELFNDMARELTREFDAEVDTTNFTISFKWSGHSINWPVKMLAQRYNLHAGMFGFESGFSTHEAYTKDNYRIRIGIKRDTDDTVLVDFNKIDEFRF